MKKHNRIISLLLICLLLLTLFSGCAIDNQKMSGWTFTPNNFVLSNYSSATNYTIDKGDSISMYYVVGGQKQLGSASGDLSGTITVENARYVSINYSETVTNQGSFTDFTSLTSDEDNENSFSYAIHITSSDNSEKYLCFSISATATKVGEITTKITIDGESVDFDKRIYVKDKSPTIEINEFTDSYSINEEEITKAFDTAYELQELYKSDASQSDKDECENRLEALYDSISDQKQIAELLYHGDMKNETYKIDYEYLDNKLSDIIAEWRKIEIDAELADEYAALSKDNTKIELEFNEISSPETDDKVLELYEKFIANNKRIAEIEEYASFTEYAYKEYYNRDYTPSDASKIYEYVKKYVVAAKEACVTDYYNYYYSMTDEELILAERIMYSSFYYLDENYIKDYMNTYSSKVSNDMMSIFVGNTAYFANGDNCYEGAYVTKLEGANKPMAYFGGQYQSLFTVIHESGHYYNEYINDDSNGAYDLFETHSQGNEAMLLAYLEDVLPENVFGLIKCNELYSFYSVIINGAMIDEFEQYCYSNDVSKDEFDDKFNDIAKEYGEDESSYWRYVTILSPCYYISYVTSAVVSTDIYYVASTNYADAQKDYLYLFSDNDEGFTDKLSKANFVNPFSESSYQKLFAVA